MNLKKKYYFLAISLLLAGGCATMNQSECQTADWNMIGLRDGANGQLVSYIDNHRRACAKHGVTPDLASYSSGHDRGVIQFCAPRNGFARGRSGNRYNGVCPKDLEEAFMDAFSLGQEIYQSNRKIRSLTSAISTKHKEIEDIHIAKNEKEQLLIYGNLTPNERANLLIEIKDLDNAIAPVEDQIFDLEAQKRAEQDNLAELNSLNVYQ